MIFLFVLITSNLKTTFKVILIGNILLLKGRSLLNSKIDFEIIIHFQKKGINADDHEYNLVRDLLATYNIYARPSVHHLLPTNVTFDMSLAQLIDVVYL